MQVSWCKQCAACGLWKPSDEFGKNKRFADGLQYYCRVCQNGKLKEWKRVNRAMRKSGAFERVCQLCGVTKPLNDFLKNRCHAGGREPVCKSCGNTRREEFRNADPSRHRGYWRKWYLAGGNRYKTSILLSDARRRARDYGLDFDLTADDIVIPELCPVLGITLRLDMPEGRRGTACDDSPSIDRVDSAHGYVRGNVRIISWRANRIKNDGNAEEHERIAAYIRSSVCGSGSST